MFHRSRPFSFLFIVVLAIGLQGCSSESTAPLNKAYHNVTSRNNAYFYGKEILNEVENSIWAGMKPDYNHILKIYPPLDSAMATTYKDQLEECIKKASIVIQYHQNSKWVDDSYNLIGIARMFGYDFPNAITTFKYVNTEAKDVNAKHWALVNLMRVFVENGEWANAEAASDYLEDQQLNKINLKTLYLTRAYFYQVLEDKDKMVRNLVLADPLLPKSERARYYFIIGQVYQELGFSAAAYEYYLKCLSSNPNYELSFYAKLNIAQVTELEGSKDLKKVRKYFKKLVKDEKNIEFQDRIYYEWGRFELKQDYLDEAITKFKLAIAHSTSNNRQKGVAYISLGEIYYDTLKNYPLAQAYYDSAVKVLPTTYEFYNATRRRAEVLTNFVKQINTIALQDSLLSLAKMDSAEVMAIFSAKAAAAQDELEQEQEKKAKEDRRERVGSVSNFDQPSGVGSSTWYFSNQSAVASGRTSFRQVWGTRMLEDHWRRSIKQVDALATNSLTDEATEKTTATTVELSRDQIILKEAQTMYAALPLTETAQSESYKVLEQAYYELGKIYYFDLDEKLNAIETFGLLHANYPESEYAAETHYLLYLMYTELNDATSAASVSEFMHEAMPNSIYTKLIDNPDYEEESNLANEKLAKKYNEVYALYLNNELDSAYAIINDLLSVYPDVSFSANLRLLQILIIGKTQPLADYQLALQEFITLYPDHELNAYAEKLLEASKTYRDNLVKLKAAEYFVTYTEDFYFVIASSDKIEDERELGINKLINQAFPKLNLSVGMLTLSDSVQLTVVESFKSKEDALLFLDSTKSEQLFSESENPYFIISKSNFDILYKSKELDTYLVFYREHF